MVCERRVPLALSIWFALSERPLTSLTLRPRPATSSLRDLMSEIRVLIPIDSSQIDRDEKDEDSPSPLRPLGLTWPDDLRRHAWSSAEATLRPRRKKPGASTSDARAPIRNPRKPSFHVDDLERL